MTGSAPKPKADVYRNARFREIAREIVWKDRNHRKYGRAVDTGGAIARAQERAYREGFAAAISEGSGSARAKESGLPPDVVEWGLIPPRPRTAFWSICLFVLGSQMDRGVGCLTPATTPRGTPGWQINWDKGLHDRVIAEATIRPLLRLGLLAFGAQDLSTLYVTDQGRASWAYFLAVGDRLQTTR